MDYPWRFAPASRPSTPLVEVQRARPTRSNERRRRSTSIIVRAPPHPQRSTVDRRRSRRPRGRRPVCGRRPPRRARSGASPRPRSSAAATLAARPRDDRLHGAPSPRSCSRVSPVTLEKRPRPVRRHPPRGRKGRRVAPPAVTSTSAWCAGRAAEGVSVISTSRTIASGSCLWRAIP